MSDTQRISLTVNTNYNFHGTSWSLWEEIRTLGRHPSRRSYHTAIVYNDTIIVVGGQDLRMGLQSGVWQFNFAQTDEEDYWQELQCQGQTPMVCRHTAVEFEDKMYVFGGSNIYEEFNDLWELDLLTKQWRCVPTQNSPSSIDSHAAVVCGDQMFVFGGFIQGLRTNDMYAISLKEFIWRKIQTSNTPEARTNHSMVVYNNSIYLFGGCNDVNERLNDLWVFDVIQENWRLIETQGQIPAGRSGHSAVMFKDNMLIFGGMKDVIKETNEQYTYNVTTNTWVMIQVDHHNSDNIEQQKEIDSPLKEESKDSPTQSHPSQWITRQKTLNSIRRSPSPESPNKRVRRIGLEGPSSPIKGRIKRRVPHARDGHTAVVIRNYMYIFGGDRHQMPFNDLYCYTIHEDTIKTPLVFE